MSVAEGVSLAGTLAIDQAATFKGSAGDTFTPVDAGHWLTGTFEAKHGYQIDWTGLYYKPAYSAHYYAPAYVHRVTVTPTGATFGPTPNSSPSGSSVTVHSGHHGEFLPGDTIALRFTDSLGSVTTCSSIVVSGSGEFSDEVDIPPLAATGNGTFTITSARTGVQTERTFTVE